MTTPDMRAFICGVLRDMEGNAVLLRATGKTAPTEKAPHGKLIVNAPRWFRYPEELDLMVAYAQQADAERADAYLSPMVYGDKPYVDSKGRTIPKDFDGRPAYSRGKDNVLFAQTVYMDSDSCPPDAFRLPPSRHVDTSEGHGHDYWFLPEPVPAALAAEVAHKITLAHRKQGTDPSGWSANKVLRLPTWNTGYDELDPYRVTWWDDDADPMTGEVGVPKVYDLDTMNEVYKDVDLPASAEAPATSFAPPPPLEGLPDFETLAQRIPATERNLNDLIFNKQPTQGEGGNRSEMRFRLLCDLKRFGFTDEETVALAWHAPASSKWREDRRGVAGLWWELQVKVLPELARERGEGVEAPTEEEAPLWRDRRREAPNLLSPAQRDRVAARSDLVTLYMEYARSKVNTFNPPYSTINAWTLLAVGLSEAAEVAKEPSPLGLGLYSFTVGGSSTGKDEANNILYPIIAALYPHDNPHVPANSSREALIETAIDRDGKVSYIHENEADGILEQVRGGGYLSGAFPLWTRLYDGEVPTLGRVGKDLKTAGKHAIVTMHFMGTPSGIVDNLDHKLFYRGYLARQIWVVGEDKPATKDSMRTKYRRGKKVHSRDPMPYYLASVLARTRAALRSGLAPDETRAPMLPTDEADELHTEAMWTLQQHFAKEHDVDLWKPVLRRLKDIVLKIAALSAASNGRTIIGSFDMEVALYYAESWVGNAMWIADRISDTYFSKQCDDIETFIAGRESHKAELGAIMRHRKGEPKRTTEDYLNSLVAQGRIEWWQAGKEGGASGYRIRERRAT